MYISFFDIMYNYNLRRKKYFKKYENEKCQLLIMTSIYFTRDHGTIGPPKMVRKILPGISKESGLPYYFTYFTLSMNPRIKRSSGGRGH